MKIGIYIPGLGDSYSDESILNYSTRFMHEIDWNHKEAKNIYLLKHETIFLRPDSGKEGQNKQRTTKVSIIERRADHTESVLYCFFDLQYNGILIDRFNSSGIFRKSILLILTIAKKSPRILAYVFGRKDKEGVSQKKKLQSFYAVILLMIIGMSGVLLIPSFVTVFSNLQGLPVQLSLLLKKYLNNNRFWNIISHYIVACSVLLFTTAKKINQSISSVAAKLVCIHYYLQIGERKQAIIGCLDNLLEYISEHEDPDATVHLHACDFGTIIGYDYLFPAGSVPTERARQKITCFCSIGFPYDFISSYYPHYFSSRDLSMKCTLSHWLNIFSIPDFFSTDLEKESFIQLFKNDRCEGIESLSYDIGVKERSTFDFIASFNLKTSQYYWDDDTEGTSCLRLLVRAMMKKDLL